MPTEGSPIEATVNATAGGTTESVSEGDAGDTGVPDKADPQYRLNLIAIERDVPNV